MLRFHEVLRSQGYKLLYADRSLFILNKPPGLVSQDSHDGQSMLRPYISGVLDYHHVKEKEFFPVHRLDKNTTGCLVLARNQRVARNFSKQLQEGSVKKTYLALVQPQDRHTLATGIGRINTPLNIVDGRVSVSANGEGKESITEWEVVSQSATSGIHLVKLNLITGLKHQLRVHMDEVLKAPILGDTLHSKYASTTNHGTSSLCLHASRIEFPRFAPKPILFSVQASLPPHFRKAYDGYIPSSYTESSLMVDNEVLTKATTKNIHRGATVEMLEKFGTFVLPQQAA